MWRRCAVCWDAWHFRLLHTSVQSRRTAAKVRRSRALVYREWGGPPCGHSTRPAAGAEPGRRRPCGRSARLTTGEFIDDLIADPTASRIRRAASSLAGRSSARRRSPRRPPRRPWRAAGLTPTAQGAGTSGYPSLFPGQNARNFAEIRNDENAHVAFLQNALGSNAFTQPQFQNLVIPSNNVNLFVATSAIFENTGVGAYLAGGALLTQPTLVQAASILAVEANHAGYSTP